MKMKINVTPLSSKKKKILWEKKSINVIQNKSFCLHNVCAVYIYYVYINIHTCMYVFKKHMLCLYIYIWYKLYEYR